MVRKNFLVNKTAVALAASSLWAAMTVFGSPAAMAQSKKPRGCCLVGSSASLPGRPVTGNLNTVWEAALLQDADEMTRLFGVRPHLFYLRENSNPNAFCTSETYPDLLEAEGASERQYPDGTIFVGLDLLREEARSTQGTLFSLPAVVAHEYAHAMQNKNRFPVYGKWRELHADYMAGYFIGHRSRFGSQNVEQAAQTLFSKGDTDFNSPDPHGTSEERRQAFIAGYNFNKISRAPSGAAAYISGMQYLQRRGASF